MKKAIMFDLDGTLWDSSAEVTQAWNDALEKLANRPERINRRYAPVHGQDDGGHRRDDAAGTPAGRAAPGYGTVHGS